MTKKMGKIEALIARHCPKGVQFRDLGELGKFYGGLTGKSKHDFRDGNAKFITYMNVFSNIAIDTDIHDFVKVDKGENQNTIEYGDVLFTASSETLNECGMSSVLTKKIDYPLYLNSFCFGFRLQDKNLFLPEFLKFIFRDESIRKQIEKTAHGVTRFNISKKRFAKIRIPLVPIAVQEEIVKFLNDFTGLKADLEAQLEAELEARKIQYEHYRTELLVFNKGEKVRSATLGEIGKMIRGTGLQKKDFTETGVGCIHYGQIHTHYGTFADRTKSFVSPPLAKKLKRAKKGDVVIAATSEDVEAVCKAVAWLGDEEIAVSGDAYIYRHNQNPKYISYFFQTPMFFDQKKKYTIGTKVIRVSGKKLEKIKIPLPSLPEQERIVSILDKFESLVTEITISLPKEIAARKAQYDHYRGKLLNFNEYVSA